MLVHTQELGQSKLSRSELAKPCRHGWLRSIVIDVSVLDAGEPGDIKRAQVTPQEVGAHGRQRGHPASSFFPIFGVLHVAPQIDNNVSATSSRRRLIANQVFLNGFNIEDITGNPQTEPVCTPVGNIHENQVSL